LRIFDKSSKHRRAMKTALLILGVLCLLVGLLWVGQGAGLVHWPASSFMIDQRPWIARGAILAIVGLVLILFARRR
jgi:spore maturation protein SpmA